MHGRGACEHSDGVTSPADDLVELPKYAPAAEYLDPRDRPKPRAKRLTLLDRLVSTARVDRVTIDLVALERDLDALRK